LASIRWLHIIQFDVKNIPAEIEEPDLVISANAVIEALYKKVDTIPLTDPVTGTRFPSLARIYIQTHLLRLLMFLEGGVHEKNSNGRCSLLERAKTDTSGPRHDQQESVERRSPFRPAI
jgi:hypothetical protein